MGDFTMPSLGADMDKGTLTEWRVAPGEAVERGQIVAVVETDKSDVEIEVFETGVVEALLVEPGTEVTVGAPLARIGTGSAAARVTGPEPPGTTELARPARAGAPKDHPTKRTRAKTKARKAGAATAARTSADRQAPAAAPIPPPAPEPATSGGAGRAHASVVLSPIVRHLAEELHVDVTSLEGTGPGGRVTRADVEHAVEASPPRIVAAPRAGAASPYARRRAAELGLDLASVAGSGPGGAIVARDLADTPAAGITHPAAPPADAASPATATAGAVATKPDRKQAMRSAIARLMSRANQEIPHYHVLSTLDVHVASEWLDRHTATHPPGERILPAAVLLRATAVACTQVPDLNGWWRDGRFEASPTVDIGVAISLRGGGLVTPTLAGADQLTLVETMAALHDLVSRARRGNLRGADLQPASITVTNLGDQGADEVIGVIQPPQVALVGFGRTVDRVCAVEGMVAVRPTVRATVSGDHRASDGHAGSLLLAAIAKALAHPDQL